MARTLARLVDPLLACNVTDIYEPTPGTRSVVFDATILGDYPPDDAVAEVKDCLGELLGHEARPGVVPTRHAV